MKHFISLMDISTDDFNKLLEEPNNEEIHQYDLMIIPENSFYAHLEKIAFSRAAHNKGVKITEINLNILPKGPVESFQDLIKAYEMSAEHISIYYPQIGTARGSGYNTIRVMSKLINRPIINMGSDSVKPSEGISLARYLHNNLDLKNKKVEIVWVFGTHNEIGFVHSYVLALAHLGADLIISAPKQFRLERKLMHAARDIARKNSGSIKEITDFNINNADILIIANWPSLDLLSSPDLHDRIRRENIERYISEINEEQQIILGEGIVREIGTSAEIFESYKHTTPIERQIEKIIGYEKVLENIEV